MSDWFVAFAAWDPEWLNHLIQSVLSGLTLGTFGTLYVILKATGDDEVKA